MISEFCFVRKYLEAICFRIVLRHLDKAWASNSNKIDYRQDVMMHNDYLQSSSFCASTWQIDIALSFLSLVLWSILIASIGSIAVIRLEESYTKKIKQHRTKRRKYISEAVTKRQFTKHDLTDLNDSLVTMDSVCSICLEDIQDGETICISSSGCRHVFHWTGCMSRWLMNHDTCPICRKEYFLRNDNGYTSPPPTRNTQLSLHDFTNDPERSTRIDPEAFLLDELPPWMAITTGIS